VDVTPLSADASEQFGNTGSTQAHISGASIATSEAQPPRKVAALYLRKNTLF
jgi:hypothetical protein